MRRGFWIVLAACALIACDKKEGTDPGTAAGATSGAATAAPTFDAAPIKARLQGKWSIKQDGKEAFTFELAGDKATMTDLRFSDPKPQSGTLRLKSAHEIGITEASGTTYKYALLEHDGAVHIGVGTVLPIAKLDAFELKLGMFNTLQRTEKGCRYTKEFAGEKKTQEVTCEVIDKDGQKRFRFQEEDPFAKGKMRDRELVVVGGKALADPDIVASIATKVAAKVAP